ncbi:MAG: oligosaccharide flippase family protein [Anaerolineae bacterium]|nr:oligosaccharide flippase family protein [Anaerolineae bacterium]
MIAGGLARARERVGRSLPAQAAAWYLAGSILHRGIDFLVAPVFLYLLTPEAYGQVAIFMTWVTLLAIVLPLRVDASVGRARFDYPLPAFRRFQAAALALGVLLGLGWLAGLALLPEEALGLFQLPREFVLLAALAALAGFAVQITLQDWRYAYQYRRYTLVTVGEGLLRTGLSITFILLLPRLFPALEGALARVLGIVIVTLGFGLVLGGHVLARGRAFISPADWRYALSYGAPLIPHQLATLALAQLDRVLIGHYAGLAAAGVYSFAYLVGSVIFMLWQSLNSAWVPWFFARMNAGEQAIIRRRARQYFLSFWALAAALIVLLPWPLGLIIPEDYRASLPLIPVIMAGSFILLPYSLYVNVAFYARATGLLSAGTVAASAVALGLNVLLIPRFGILAAAWVTVAGYGLLFLVHAGLVRFGLRQRDLFDFWLMLGGGVALVLLAGGMSAWLGAG